jgi:hypothetical protein
MALRVKIHRKFLFTLRSDGKSFILHDNFYDNTSIIRMAPLTDAINNFWCESRRDAVK